MSASAVLGLTAACGTDVSTAPVPLHAGESFDLSPTEEREFSFQVPAGTVVLFTATQDGIDLGMAIVDRDDLIVDTPIERDGIELLAIESRESTAIAVRIFSNERGEISGRSTFRAIAVPLQSRSDRQRADAALAFTEASATNRAADLADAVEDKQELRQRSADLYTRAAEHWESVGESNNQALALYCRAYLEYLLEDWSGSAATAAAAAELLSETGSAEHLLARIRHAQGQALLETGVESDLDIAEARFIDALEFHETNGEKYYAAITVNSLGILDFYRGDLKSARQRFLDAGRFHEAAGELREASKTYNNVGKIDENFGELLGAINSYEKAMQLADQARDTLLYAEYLENSADAHAILGNMQRALLLYSEAERRFAVIGEEPGIARAKDGIGVVYMRLGDWDLAERYLQESLEHQAGPAEIRPLVETYTKLGITRRNRNDISRAREAHDEALRLADRQTEKAAAHLELGRDYQAGGDLSKAAFHFRESLRLAKGTDAPLVEAFAMTETGALQALEDPATGVGNLQAALELHRALDSEFGEAQTLAFLARATQAAGETDTALGYANSALELVERLRYRAGNPRLRYAYTGAQWPTYELVIDLNMDLHLLAESQQDAGVTRFDAAALEISERAKARTLAELLLDAKPDEGQEGASELTEEHRVLRLRLAEAAFRKNQASDAGDAQDIENEIAALVTRMNVIEARLRAQNPLSGYESTERTTVADIQRMLHPDGMPNLLLEFSLGETRSVVWAVTDTSLHSFILPGRAEIEARARAVYAGLRSPPGTRPAGDFDSTLRQLSSTLLGPVSGIVSGRRVIVIPDGALHYLPFGALVSPDSGNYLIEDAEVIVLPSATILALQRELADETVGVPAAIAVVADPVFSASDGRLSTETAGTSTDSRLNGERSTERAGSLSRLAFTAQEADAISDIAASANVPVKTFVGFEASRRNLLGTSLHDFGLLHFASHGLVNTERPELSAIALSAFDEEGRLQPHLLQLADVRTLDLNARVVVLSACDTATGAEIKGEGLLGLTHAFMNAGARSVVATTWAVQDRATAELMRRFYENLLTNNMPPSAALRDAQRRLASNARWRAPYFWAPFVYIGDWNMSI